MTQRRSRTLRCLGAASALVAIALLAGGCFSPECDFERVEIAAANGADARVFSGRHGAVAVRFLSERADPDVAQFPEPPVVVRNESSDSECQIEDGGIWVRAGVFVSAGGDVLVLQEYSGSNEWLAFYDSSSCTKLGEIDVSEARWALGADAVRVGRGCSGDSVATCQDVRAEPLGRACVPSRKP